MALNSILIVIVIVIAIVTIVIVVIVAIAIAVAIVNSNENISASSKMLCNHSSAILQPTSQMEDFPSSAAPSPGGFRKPEPVPRLLSF